jgi:hypothetical protein
MLYLLVHSALDGVKAFGISGQTTLDATLAQDLCEKSGDAIRDSYSWRIPQPTSGIKGAKECGLSVLCWD